MNYQEYFQLTASSPLDLRLIVSDYLSEQGIYYEAMRAGLCAEYDRLDYADLMIGYSPGRASGYGDGYGHGYGIGSYTEDEILSDG